MLYPTKSDHFGLSCPDHDFVRQLRYNCSPFAIWARIFGSIKMCTFWNGRVLTENGMVGSSRGCRFESRVCTLWVCLQQHWPLQNCIDIYSDLRWNSKCLNFCSFPLTPTMGNRDHRMIMAKTRLAGHLVHPDSNFGTVHCSTRRVLKSRA